MITALALAFLIGQTAPVGPGDHLRTLEVDGLKRTFWVHVPPQYDPQKPMPVVLALHGATMTAKVMEAFTGLNSKADAGGFIVVYPNGTGPNPLLYTWNSGGFNKLIEKTKPNDVVFLAKVLEEVESIINVDTKRIYATGLSNGAMMCYRLAAEMPEKFAAIAPVAGTIAVDKFEPKCCIPILHIHGTVDALVPYEGSNGPVSTILKFRSVEDTIALCLKCNRCTANPKITEIVGTRDKYKIICKIYEPSPDGAEVLLYVVEGGGHTWPGRPFAGGVLGTVTMNLEANEVIWAFFQRHCRK